MKPPLASDHTPVRTWLRRVIVAALVLIGIGGSYAYYLYSRPHRDVVATAAEEAVDAADLVNAFLTDEAGANARYLDAEGESKVLAVSGTVARVETDLNGQPVVLLLNDAMKAGVRCTFDPATAADATGLVAGQQVTLKGVIRAGAAYDADLEFYEHAVLEKCSIVQL